ncbi:hypothetical protein [Sinorhizobium fredii]|uniref:hypothetical protein n=1 Tax=Rhizobium fredii TaxID=380 RepID=UPI00068547AA|nr:hypothetical protein [Sinorhizobium fredii]MQW97472.1 hypothetical protein [Sinorhizobium fredii]
MTLIDQLAAMEEPQRRIDQAIAELFKFRRETTNLPAHGNAPARLVVTWYDPNGNEVGNVPKFTGSIDAAKFLLDLVIPNAYGGFSYHHRYAQAQIGDGEVVTAFNVPTALCLATIKAAQP